MPKIKNAGSRAKPIIISASAAAAALAAVIGWTAYQTSRDNRAAELKYEFNQFYPGSFDTPEKIDSEQDFDRDGLTNAEEAVLSTNASVPDSDGDGILDGYEKQNGTDPSAYDSDGDGLGDGIEILAGLDPLTPQTDGTPDEQRRFTREIPFDEGVVTLTGNAEIFGASVEKLSLFSISSNAGALSFPYEIYCETPPDSVKIRFRYSDGLLKAAGIEPAQVHIYRFHPKTKSFSEAGGTADPQTREIFGETEGNGVYLIGAENGIRQAGADENTEINIHLLIDNSGSMYPSTSRYASEENDTEFKRLVFAANLISKLGENARAAVTAFTYSCKTLCDFTNDKTKSTAAVNQLRSIGAGYDGTSVERALMLALDSFPADSKNERNMIILLTDGISTDTAGYTLDQITDSAQAKNVTIMTISLGNSIDRELLRQLADRTGGKYFPISDANALEGLYSTLIATMENDIVDEDQDGTPESYSLFDTGFRAEENGFSFGNFKSRDCATMDFGMAMLARDWFVHRVVKSGGGEDPDLTYDFEKTSISLNKPLSGVILTSMGASYLKPDSYLDFSAEGGTLHALKAVEEEAKDLGWVTHTETLPENQGGWTQAEYLVPNYAMGKLRVKYGDDDYHMLRAIGWYNTFRDKGKSFALTDEAGLNLVKSILGSGEPILMKMTWEENGGCFSRYTDLTALRRDLENPNVFHLKIYDTNADSSDTVVLNRTMKLTGDGKFNGDYTYSASWNDRGVSVSFYLTEAE